MVNNMDVSLAKIGDHVKSSLKGWGIIIRMDENYFTAEFNGVRTSYNYDGKYKASDKKPDIIDFTSTYWDSIKI